LTTNQSASLAACGEFDLIARYFARAAPKGILGVGDDCALLPLSPGRHLAVSTDMLMEGRHFFPDVDPAALGHKALAVNLSDLAAMGATPLACVLSLALPRADALWLEAFSRAMHDLASHSACPLVGGDTVRSGHGIVINMTVLGQVPAALALRRDAARAGDDIWVSGALGEADVALRLLQGRLPMDAALLAQTRRALEWPQAQLALGQAVLGVAHAAIDLSDGLVQDLNHILVASACGAVLHVDALPVAHTLRALPQAVQHEIALSGGDGYQLCFTAAVQDRNAVQARAAAVGATVARIGQITAQQGLCVVDRHGVEIPVARGGFDHFSEQGESV